MQIYRKVFFFHVGNLLVYLEKSLQIEKEQNTDLVLLM